MTDARAEADLWLRRWLDAGSAAPSYDLEAFLAQVPPALQAEVRELILDHQALAEAVQEEAPAFQEGQTVGDFLLVRELGRGGMGSVWEAEQLSLKRRVALKLLKPQLGISPAFLDRFQREAEAGGRLQHPGIVQVYGVGAAGGVHWIAQELVPGGFTLADSLAEQRETTALPEDWYPGVAELFARVAEALEHAHQAGVIHRDIKPQNLLITEDEQPKVADFGLAQVQDDLALSRTGEFLGTPFYMSPEQAVSKRMGLDHRSDVFSLGATLYEALTLVRAFDGDTSQQVFQKIITEEPPPPQSIRSRVPRDLAVICGKCLEKSPERRYGSMAELAADLRRHLNDEPILAKPPGSAMRAVKWCRRHPVVAVGGTVALVALAAISALSVRLAREQSRTQLALVRAQGAEASAREEAGRAREAEAEQARQRELAEAARSQAETQKAAAEQRASELRQVTDFQSGQLEALDAEALGWGVRQELFRLLEEPQEGRKRTPKEVAAQRGQLEQGLVGLDFTGLGLRVLDRFFFSGALEAVEKFNDQPKVQAQLLQTLAEVMRKAGLLEQAEAPQRRALEIRRLELGEDHADTLLSIGGLAMLLHDRGEALEAEALYRAALDGQRRVLGDEHPNTLISLSNLANVLRSQGKLAEAESLSSEALTTSQRTLGADHVVTHTAQRTHARVLLEQGKLLEAAPLFRQALAGSRQVLGPEHRSTLNSLNDLGVVLRAQGKLAEAEHLIRDALEIQRRTLGEVHPDTLSSTNNLATVLYERGKLEEAEPLLRAALEVQRATLGEAHPSTLRSMSNLAVLLLAREKPGEAEPLFRQALEVRRRTFGEAHPQTLNSISHLAYMLQTQGKLAEAEPLFREVLEATRRTMGAEHPQTIASLNNLGALLLADGRPSEAEPLFRQALAGHRRALGNEHPNTLGSINNLAALLYSHGKLLEAEPLFREALAGWRRTLGDAHSKTLTSINSLAVLLRDLGRTSEAEPLFLEALAGRRRTLGEEHSQTLSTLEILVLFYLKQDRPAHALPLAEELLKNTNEDAPQYGERHKLLEKVRAAVEGGED